MTTKRMSQAIQHLRKTLLQDGAGMTDGQLLACFIEQRDEAAFAALVKRHGPMVWGVCRRLLPHHDAEDVFQATFLVLVRKATSIRPREMLANWLYGVAHHTALHSRRTATRRRTRERQVTQMPELAVAGKNLWHDLQPVLDQELSRLPDKYRVALVLCDLKGKTRKEAARQLGCPEGTLAARLARGRIMLARRLARHGLAMSGGVLAGVVSQNVASADVPTSVVSSTIKAASTLAAGRAAGLISVKVAGLTQGVVKAMLLTKIKAVLGIVLALGFVTTGAGILGRHMAAAQGDKLATAVKYADTPKKQEQEREKEPFTAWGKEVNGLQAGLGFRPGEHGVRQGWGMVTLVVRVRNVSMKEVTFQYCPESDWTRLPDVTDAKGKPIAIKGGFLPNNCSLKKVSLAPGKSIELWQWKLNLRPESESTKPPPDNPPYATLDGPGKFIIQYPWVSAWKLELKPPKTWAKLGTGKLEIEVKADPPQKQEQKEQKEGFTAWAKEIGGLQAGLGYLPGQNRAYHTGETVTLVVRIRNVSKEVVKCQYDPWFFTQKAPAVTDSAGKLVHFRYGVDDTAQVHPPTTLNLAPGKELVLGEVKLPTASLGTGKFTVQYEQVFGKSYQGTLEVDPTLKALGTGKLNLEIKADPPPAAKKDKKQDPDAWFEKALHKNAQENFKNARKALQDTEMAYFQIVENQSIRTQLFGRVSEQDVFFNEFARKAAHERMERARLGLKRAEGNLELAEKAQAKNKSNQ